jgi:hypothetical protein
VVDSSLANSKENQNRLANKISKKITEDEKKIKNNGGKASEENFYKSFGKIEMPFGDPYQSNNAEYKFVYKAKSKTFSLRTLPFT